MSKLTYVSSSFVLKMAKMRVETSSVNYDAFDESSKKLAKQRSKVSNVSEVESKGKEKVHRVTEAT